MFIFWIIAALMVLLALWFVVPTLLQATETKKRDEIRAANVIIYQDQYHELESDLKNGLISEEQYQQDKDELERRLLDDVEAQKDPGSHATAVSPGARRLAYGVGAGIPITAIAFYFLVGNPNALKSQPAPTAPPAVAPFAGQQGAMSQQQIEANIGKLAQRLQENPNDAEGWIMLGRSYTVLERFADAADAYAHATALDGDNADAWADYAGALAMANGRLAGKPVEALNRALQKDPQNLKALALSGSAAFETDDYKKAIEQWQKLLTLLPPNSEEARAVSDRLAKAKELAVGGGSR